VDGFGVEVLKLVPQLGGLIWAIWFMGGKIDRLTESVSELNKNFAVMLDRKERVGG